VAIDTTSAFYRQGLVDEVPPFGIPDNRTGFGLNDADTDPVDAGSDGPQEQEDDYVSSGSEDNALRGFMARCRERVKASVPGCIRVNVERRDRLTDYGFRTVYAVYVWTNEVTPHWGEADTLTGAVAAAVSKATAPVVAAVAGAGKAVAHV
jgi:hypothetical protein